MNERLKKRKEELGMTTEALSKLSGVPVGTINKILTGETKSPRCNTLAALERVLFPEEVPAHQTMKGDGEAFPQKRQGEYTLTDYYALPEDIRAELIDGELFIMEAPDLEHQLLISELSCLFSSFIRRTKRKCLVLCAPLDVQLDCDDCTMVQPDILISWRA